MHGAVFYKLQNGQKRSCSGTVVHSQYGSMVWTAGSCVADAANHRFWNDVVFVPGYKNGDAPFGRWPAEYVFAKTDFIQHGNQKLDYGAIVTGKRQVDGHLRSLEAVVGSKRIEFNQPRSLSLSLFGYPDNATFDGKREFRCDAKSDGTDDPGGAGRKTTRLPCPASSASKGAGWVDGGSLFSVTAYTHSNDHGHVFGPYFDEQAKSLYDLAAERQP
jgi:hypothetical protein